MKRLRLCLGVRLCVYVCLWPINIQSRMKICGIDVSQESTLSGLKCLKCTESWEKLFVVS